MRAGGAVRVLVVVILISAAILWSVTINTKQNCGGFSASENYIVRDSNFTKVSEVEWTNGTSSNPILALVGSMGNAIVVIGDTDGDGSCELVSTSSDQNETWLFQYERQGSLRLWEYDGNSFTLVDEKVWHGNNKTIGGYANDVRIFEYNGNKYVITAGSIQSVPSYADIRIWRYSPNGFTFVSNYTWRHYSDKNSTANSVVVGDVNEDGVLEVVTGGEISWKVGNNDNNTMGFLTVFRLNSDLTLTKLDEVIISDNEVYATGISDVEIGDIDNSGSIEIIAGGCYGFNDSGVERARASISIWNFHDNLSKINEVQWIDMESCGVLDIVLYDFDHDEMYEIVSGGANKKLSVAGEIAVWSHDLQELARTQFFINPGGQPGNLNWDCFASDIEIWDFDGDGSEEIIATGASKGPPPPGASGNTFWGYLASFTFSGSSLVMDAKYYWLDKDLTHIMKADSADIDSDGTREIITIGYTIQKIDNRQQMYAKIWVWRYVSTVPEIPYPWIFSVTAVFFAMVFKRREI